MTTLTFPEDREYITKLVKRLEKLTRRIVKLARRIAKNILIIFGICARIPLAAPNTKKAPRAAIEKSSHMVLA